MLLRPEKLSANPSSSSKRVESINWLKDSQELCSEASMYEAAKGEEEKPKVKFDFKEMGME